MTVPPPFTPQLPPRSASGVLPDPRVEQALELCRSGHPDTVDALHREWLTNPPQDAPTLTALVEMARLLGQPIAAVGWAEAVVRTASDAVRSWCLLALTLIAAGRIQEAETAAEQALRRLGAGPHDGHLDNAQTHRAIALIRLRQGRLMDAAQACETALRSIAQHDDPPSQNARAETRGTLALVRMLEGRFSEADALFRQALDHRPMLPEILGNHASLLARLGHDTEALEQATQAVALRPRLLGTLHLIGTLHHRAGRLPEAIAVCRRVLAMAPEQMDTRLLLADALNRVGAWQEAVAVCQDGLRLDAADVPSVRAALLTHSGAALQSGGDCAGALAAHRHALELAPTQQAALNNLARLHRETGDPEAINTLRRIAETAGSPSGVRLTLLSLLLSVGRIAEAEAEAFAHAQSAPENAELSFAIAATFLDAGRRASALPYAQRAIRLAPDTPRHWIGFVDALRDPALSKVDESLRPDLLAALNRPEVDAPALAWAMAALLRESPILQRLAALPNSAAAVLSDAEQTLLSDGALETLASDAVFLAHLRTTPIIDPVLEYALSHIRRLLLLTLFGPGLPDRAVWQTLCAALAEQCFLTEYVLPESTCEPQMLPALVHAISAAIDQGTQPRAVLVALLGAYHPLHQWPWSDALNRFTWPEAIIRLLTRQCLEPAAEAIIAASLPTLTPIHNPTSVDVRAQYEENPYPRWLSTGVLPEPVPLARFLRGLFPHIAPSIPSPPGWESPDVLIAGCGTGREAVWSATTLKHARVLAVDLSRRSLAYAARQSQQLGLSIDFAQADLLELGGQDRRFDVIHSVGVLHHMDDPMAGLRALRALLRPHGVMELGLYSATARRPILAVRNLLAGSDLPSTPDGIRRLRQIILSLPDDHPGRAVIRSPDFYGISPCRDLLMHVRELHATLPWLDHALKALDLEFLGFRLSDPAVGSLYRRRFPDDPSMTSLAHWNQLEDENPTIFGGMYQLWTRARG